MKNSMLISGLEVMLFIFFWIGIPLLFFLISFLIKKRKDVDINVALRGLMNIYWIFYITILFGYILYGGIFWW